MSSRSQDLVAALIRQQREILATLAALAAAIEEEIQERVQDQLTDFRSAGKESD
jgi:flagellar biosynthesis/type III secretory pathway protein FliH